MAIDTNASLIMGGAQTYEDNQRRSAEANVEVKDPALRAAIRRMMMGEDPRAVAREMKLAARGYLPNPATSARVEGENPAARFGSQATSALPQLASPVRPTPSAAPTPSLPGHGPLPPELVAMARNGAMQEMQQPSFSGMEQSVRAPPTQQAPTGPSQQELEAPMLMRDAQLAMQLGSVGTKLGVEERIAIEAAKHRNASERQAAEHAHRMRQTVMKLDSDWRMLGAKLATARAIANDRNATAQDIAAARATLTYALGISGQITRAAMDVNDPFALPGYADPAIRDRMQSLTSEASQMEPIIQQALQSLQQRQLSPPAQAGKKPSSKPAQKPAVQPASGSTPSSSRAQEVLRRMRGGQ